ncbi:hypothetical protein GCM10023321_51270 [Pseudonocardia eucalypti]|uniref:Uncharacterized protein n=1 Tax=Pseudonocardia eucalypti TaxID=648755 RepID=A0ABP9QL91_9PSEU|nr:hypothetical protein [Pseudonocardia eucalypti]
MSRCEGGRAGATAAFRGLPGRRTLSALLATLAALTAFLAPPSFGAHSPGVVPASATAGAAGAGAETPADFRAPALFASPAEPPVPVPAARLARFASTAAEAERTDPWSPRLGRAPPEFRRS